MYMKLDLCGLSDTIERPLANCTIELYLKREGYCSLWVCIQLQELRRHILNRGHFSTYICGETMPSMFDVDVEHFEVVMFIRNRP